MIESSADYPSVCLTDEQGNLLWQETVFIKQSHSEQLPGDFKVERGEWRVES